MGKKTLWPPGFGLEELEELKSKLTDLGLTTKAIKNQEDITKYTRKWQEQFGSKKNKARGGPIKKYAKGGGVRKAARY